MARTKRGGAKAPPRSCFGTGSSYGVWLIIALAAVFATLALLNTAAMATGVPLSVPVLLAGGALAAVAVLTLGAGAVTARLALRVPPAAAMRAEE